MVDQELTLSEENLISQLLTQMKAIQEEVKTLKQQTKTQETELTELRTLVNTPTTEKNLKLVDKNKEIIKQPIQKTSRRNLMKLVGASAAAAVTVGLVGGAEKASAANTNPIIMGTTNVEETSTMVKWDGTASQSVMLLANDTNIAPTSTPFGAALGGWAGGTANSSITTGVYGLSSLTNGVGVIGVTTTNNSTANDMGAVVGSNAVNGNGVSGTSVSGGSGVNGYATGASGYGVYGSSDAGYGVVGASTTGIDLSAAGTGRVWVTPQATTGAPTSGAHLQGELIVDSNGVYYTCTTSGTPGTWKRMQTTDQGLHIYSISTRVVKLFPNGPFGPLTKGIHTGISAGVPAGATAAYAAVQSFNAGVLTLYPDGNPDPQIVNWASVVNGPYGNQANLNFHYMMIPLSAAGKFSFHSYFTDTLYIDIWGYVL